MVFSFKHPCYNYKFIFSLGYKARMLGALMAVMALWATAAMAGLNDDLIKTAELSNLTEVKSLIGKGAEVNAKTNAGTTALMFASQKGHREIRELLLKAELNNWRLMQCNSKELGNFLLLFTS